MRRPTFFSPIPPLRYLFFARQAKAIAAIFIFAFSGIQWLLPYLVYTRYGDECGQLAAGAVHRRRRLHGDAADNPAPVGGDEMDHHWPLQGRRVPLRGVYYCSAGGWYAGCYPPFPRFSWPGRRSCRFIFGFSERRSVRMSFSRRTTSMRPISSPMIGDRAIVGRGAALASSSVERGVLRLGRCRVGTEASVGTMAVLGHDTAIGAGAALEDLSALTPGENIPPGDVWGGSPASPRGRSAMRVPEAAPPGALRRWAITALLLVAIGILPLVAVLPIAPGLIGMMERRLDDKRLPCTSLLSPVLALVYIVSMCLLTVAIKWALLGRVKGGRLLPLERVLPPLLFCGKTERAFARYPASAFCHAYICACSVSARWAHRSAHARKSPPPHRSCMIWWT